MMRNVIAPVALTGMAMMLSFPVCRSGNAPSGCAAGDLHTTTLFASTATNGGPTFNQTRDFILKHTPTTWSDTPGSLHSYALNFAGKRLKYTHRFTSEYMPGYTEKFDVDLGDLDPQLIGTRVKDGNYILLTATDEQNRVNVEFTAALPGDESNNRKFTQSTLSVPATGTDASEADRMDARLKRAWSHLIQLAGGKPSQQEPF